MSYQRLPLTAHGAWHGYTKTPTYGSWQNMRTRCENPKSTQWKWYGALGVKVCDRWKTFGLFLQDMGERPSPSHTLDRYPNNTGDYEPGNVRWATKTEQCRNRKSTRAVIRSDGVRFPSMPEAAEAVGGDHKGIWAACNGDQKTHRGFSWRYA
jgi:hypothetical protein